MLGQSQVYAQVKGLFKGAPDLLDEFQDFLPGILGQDAEPAPKKAAAPLKRKKKVEKDTTPVPPAKVPIGRVRVGFAPHNMNSKIGILQTKKQKQSHESPSFSPAVAVMPPPAQPIASTSTLPPQPVSQQDKLLFFDRAKKHLESREIYDEFLKLLNLFSKEIIDAKALVTNAQVFLGDGELLTEFIDLVGCEDPRVKPTGPPGSLRTGAGYSEALLASLVDEGQGPSYRRLPETEVRLACSGRDELCRSVLNDVWVSHPTWASEDAGFVTHKKNTFEEALHRSEEERHEYHIQIQALTATISLLEPLAARLEDMDPDDRAQYRIKADFGGPSMALYHRVIKKVYGKDAGGEIIQKMQESPGVAVPVVLARLVQKDGEWRRAQREWSRTWREVDARNFYKSLDHQGISYKANDKKAITAKHFVGDIERIKIDQLKARNEVYGTREIPVHLLGSVGYQLDYQFDDEGVVHDALRLVYSFLDHSATQYGAQERRAIEKFFKTFVPVLFMRPPAESGSEDEDEPRKKSKGSKGRQSTSRQPSPVNVKKDEDVWVVEADPKEPPQVSAVDRRPFFANTTFYTLIRLIQV
jgi:paired amphipathic helix protein Sin3a